jgi:2-oxoglutarate ferredoxin oxidoreductase subunit delta
MAKGRITIDDARCKGCALCVTACQHNLIRMAEERLNARGYHPAIYADPAEACTGCTLCAVICPDACITVFRLQKPVASRHTVAPAV